MRSAFTYILLFLMCFSLSIAMVYSKGFNQMQSGDINLIISSESTLKEALNRLELKSHAHFMYEDKMIQGIRINVIEIKNANLVEALNEILKSTPFEYKVAKGSNTILIVKRPYIPPPTKIHGKVLDAKTKEPLPGVSILEKGTSNGTFTDANGNFTLTILHPETAVLIVKYISYTTLQIKVGNTKEFTILITQNSNTLTEVRVRARMNLNTEKSILTERKNSAVVSDAISAQQITKTASITTVQALQRVAGVTITDDKYVAIRGLGDRSVVAQLNGARLSSSDPDRSSVPLDLVPAALLDNVTVYKTETPDKPADAAAGLIELKTKSVPEALIVQFTAQTGTNSNIGYGGKFTSWQGSEPGFFGQFVNKNNLKPDFLNLSKQYPGGVPQIDNLILDARNSLSLTKEALRINGIMHEFTPVLTTQYEKATPNQIYAINFGNTFKLFKNHPLGVVVGLSYYNRTEDQSNSILNQYSIYQGFVTGNNLIFGGLSVPPNSTPDVRDFGKYLGYKQDKGLQTLNYGGLLGLTYKINTNNEVSFQYLGSWGAEIEGESLNGTFQNTGINFPIYNQIYGLKQIYRTFRNINLQGEHKLWTGAFAPQISWHYSRSKSTQNEPDFRFIDVANEDETSLSGVFGVPVGTNLFAEVSGVAHVNGPNNPPFVADPNGRRFRFLNESNNNYSVDITVPSLIFKQKVNFKLGGNYLRRDRTFTENVLGLPGSTYDTSPNAGTILTTLKGNLSQLVGYDKIGVLGLDLNTVEGGSYTPGFIYQVKKSPNNYIGSYQTEAIYAMLDAHLSEKLRLIGGLRLETTDIRALVDTANVYQNPGIASGGAGFVVNNNVINPYTGYSLGFKPYYSGNLVYALEKNMNLRLAFSTTLSRPELREITNIYEFDPFQFAIVGGNPNLRNQLTRSADFRWEWFPTSGEVFALSAFGKEIYHQLTKTFKLNSLGTLTKIPEYPIIVFQNDSQIGKVYGFELEARKDLGKISPILNHFFLGTNVLLAQSIITKNPERLAASRIINRFASAQSPIFEQAPYSVNAYFEFDNPKSQTNITTVFNMVGERLIQVQLDGTPDIYSRPTPILDFIFSQQLGKRFLIKGFAKNILNPAFEQVYTVPNNNGDFNGKHYTYQKYYRGIEMALGITFNLF